MRQLNLPTRLVAILEDNKPATAGASRANRPLKTLRVIPISLLCEDSGVSFQRSRSLPHEPSRRNNRSDSYLAVVRGFGGVLSAMLFCSAGLLFCSAGLPRKASLLRMNPSHTCS